MIVFLMSSLPYRQLRNQRQMITRALEQNNRSWAACARALEMDVANLHRLAKRLGLKG